MVSVLVCQVKTKKQEEQLLSQELIWKSMPVYLIFSEPIVKLNKGRFYVTLYTAALVSTRVAVFLSSK